MLARSRRVAVPIFLLACACGAEATSVPRAPPSAHEPASATPASAGATDDVGAVHRARCGACHVRVEPGTRTRDALQIALSRHRKRVHLSETQWTALVDYLAPAG